MLNQICIKSLFFTDRKYWDTLKHFVLIFFFTGSLCKLPDTCRVYDYILQKHLALLTVAMELFTQTAIWVYVNGLS